MIEEVAAKHSIYDEYSEYNDGWTDACNFIELMIEEAEE